MGIHKEIAIRWDDIAAISPETTRTSAVGHPLIAIHLRLPHPGIQHLHLPLQWDTPDWIAIPAYLLAAEPNTLQAILRFLKEHPDQRSLLDRPDSPTWFTPPSQTV
ncbi:hypothetical protein JMUB6875_15140 [Nocardia sp. JMUB6875]